MRSQTKQDVAGADLAMLLRAAKASVRLHLHAAMCHRPSQCHVQEPNMRGKRWWAHWPEASDLSACQTSKLSLCIDKASTP